jgi:hypothetical protein
MLSAEETLFVFSAMSWNPQSLVPLVVAHHNAHTSSALTADELQENLLSFFGAVENLVCHSLTNVGRGLSVGIASRFALLKSSLLPLLRCIVKPNDALRRSLQPVPCLGLAAGSGAQVLISGRYPALQPPVLHLHKIGLLVQCFAGASLDEMRAKMWPLRGEATNWREVNGENSTSAAARLAAASGLALHVDAACSNSLIRVIVPAVDDETHDMTQYFLPELWALCRCTLTDDNQSVLFYCSAGMHRSATMLAAFMIHSAWRSGDSVHASPEAAVDAVVDLINGARKFAKPPPPAIQQLRGYAISLSVKSIS